MKIKSLLTSLLAGTAAVLVPLAAFAEEAAKVAAANPAPILIPVIPPGCSFLRQWSCS
jgi:hypothetical protein